MRGGHLPRNCLKESDTHSKKIFRWTQYCPPTSKSCHMDQKLVLLWGPPRTRNMSKANKDAGFTLQRQRPFCHFCPKVDHACLWRCTSTDQLSGLQGSGKLTSLIKRHGWNPPSSIICATDRTKILEYEQSDPGIRASPQSLVQEVFSRDKEMERFFFTEVHF